MNCMVNFTEIDSKEKDKGLTTMAILAEDLGWYWDTLLVAQTIPTWHAKAMTITSFMDHVESLMD